MRGWIGTPTRLNRCHDQIGLATLQKDDGMKIRAGFSIEYECQNETPMLLVLKIHPSRERDLCTEQNLSFSRPISHRDYLDGYGNACSRILAPPAGR